MLSEHVLKRRVAGEMQDRYAKALRAQGNDTGTTDLSDDDGSISRLGRAGVRNAPRGGKPPAAALFSYRSAVHYSQLESDVVRIEQHQFDGRG